MGRRILTNKEKKMKYVIALLLALALIGCAVAEAADGDITKEEARPSVSVYKMAHVLFNIASKQCIVRYDKYAGEENVGDEVKVIFMNVEDDTSTPENEESTEFTQLVTAINNNSNIKTTITNAVKIKLGL